MKKIKILFAGHDLKFAQIIMNYFDSQEKYDVRTDKWRSHNSHDQKYSMDCLQWADVIVCEWGLGNAVWYSENKLPQQYLIVRMHRQELETEYPKRFVIENIDRIIAISPHIYEEFYRYFKFPREKMVMIYNLVDTLKLDLPKIKDSHFNLGIIGVSPKLKRLDRAIDIFEKLWQKDSRYKLFIKGKMPQEIEWLWKKEEERNFYLSLFERIETSPWKNNVVFDSFGSDIDEWLKKIGYILSMSDYESFHLAVAEGMASGAYPIVLNWDGSNTIYPDSYRFGSIDECVDEIIELNKISKNGGVSGKVKEYVNKHFSVKKIGREWDNLIANYIKNN